MTLIEFVVCSVIWTGLLAGVTEILTRKDMTAHGAQALWRACAVLMVLPWLVYGLNWLMPGTVGSVATPLPWPDLVEFHPAMSAGDRVANAVIESTGKPDSIASEIIAAVLVVGWIVRAGAALGSRIWLIQLQSQSFPLNDPELSTRLARAAKTTGLAKPPWAFGIDTNHSPFVCGLLKPRLYLTPSSLNSEGLDFVLVHECMHIARGDLYTRTLERMVADLIWFSPFAWLARTRLDQWREAVCDAETVRRQGDALRYARTLVETARSSRPITSLPVATLFSNPKRTLTMRISSVITEPKRKTAKTKFFGGLVFAAAAVPLALAQGLIEDRITESAAPNFVAAIIDHPDARITSSYGERTHPITKEPAFHSGTDIGAPYGTQVILPAAGEVVTTGERRGYGLIVEVELEANKDRLRFAQLQSYNVNVGDKLAAGDPIGEVGASGRGTGPHLHLEYFPRALRNESANPEDIEGLTLIAGE